MPSVTPSDSNSTYTRRLNELEAEIREEGKRAQARHHDQETRLEDGYKKTISEKEKELQNTVEHVQNGADETVQRARENARRDAESSRKDSYDRLGRYIARESEANAERDKQLNTRLEQADSKNKALSADTQNAYDDNASARAQSYNDQLEKSVQAARDSANENFQTQIAKKDQDTFDSLKQNQEKLNKLNQERASEQNEIRRTAQRAIEETRTDFERRAGRDQASSDARLEKASLAMAARNETAGNDLRNSHAAETAQYRAQVRDLVFAEEHKPQGKETVDVIKQYNTEHRADLDSQGQAYQAQIDKLKSQEQESGSNNSARSQAALREQEAKFTRATAELNQAKHQDNIEFQKDLNHDHDQLVAQNTHDKQNAEAAAEARAVAATQQREEALQKQGEAYQTVLRLKAEANDSKTNRLQNRLTESETSGDVSLVSPHVEATIRNQIIREYEKTSGAERESNQRAFSQARENSLEKIRDISQEKDASRTHDVSEQIAQRHVDQTQFNNYISDTEYAKNQAIFSAHQDNDQMSSHLQKTYTGSLSQQKREFDEVASAQKTDSDARIAALRQESEFQIKMQSREASTRDSELIRNYDKKLTDQKVELGTQIDELKAQMQTQVRDIERRSRLDLENQGRSYEQKIAQLEYQHKERERLIAANHEDELDKVRKSNALLIQRRST